MEKALNSIILSDSAINSAVSGRVSPLKRDEDFPAITYEKKGVNQEIDTRGRVSGVIESGFSIISRAKTYGEAKTISDLIAAKLSGLSGTFFNKDILLVRFNDESVDQLLDPDITELTLDYTFYHR